MLYLGGNYPTHLNWTPTLTRHNLAALAGRFSFFGQPEAQPKLTLLQGKTEILSGLTVALAMVPEAVAFSFVAGVHPLVGMYAAFFVGLITALFGGRPGMISGATGALAVVMVSLVSAHGVEYLFATVVLMGAMQLFAGIFHLGKFIRLVPHPVMMGFVNGLAIIIFLAQLSQFQVTGPDGGKTWMSGMPLTTMLGLVALTMAIIWLMPKLTKAVPAPLAAIAIVAGLVIAFGLDVPRVGDLASIEGGLPSLHLPMVPLTFETLRIIFPYALILAMIGLIESLLTLNLVGEITNQRGGASRECVAQGLANTVTGFFGGMGGCAMIGQSMINVKSGGRHRGGVIPAGLHPFCLRPDRANPAGGVGRRHVHGRHRHVRVAEHHDPPQDPDDRCLRHVAGDRCHGRERSRRRRRRRRDRLGTGLCVEQCQAYPRDDDAVR